MDQRLDVGRIPGWDWSLKIDGLEFECVQVGLPHTNIMLIDQWHRDYGWTDSLNTLATIVDAIPWSGETCCTVIRHCR